MKIRGIHRHFSVVSMYSLQWQLMPANKNVPVSHNSPLAFRNKARRQGIVCEPIRRHLLEDQRITKVAQEPRQAVCMETSLASEFINVAFLVPEKTRDIRLTGHQQRRFIMVLQ